MRSRGSLILTVVLIAASVGYFVWYERALRQQRVHGFRSSGTPSDDRPYDHAVFAIGDVFLTFDSTANDSALWLVRPSGTLMSLLFPPSVRRLDYVRLIQWNSPGRIAWSLMG